MADAATFHHPLDGSAVAFMERMTALRGRMLQILDRLDNLQSRQFPPVIGKTPAGWQTITLMPLSSETWPMLEEERAKAQAMLGQIQREVDDFLGRRVLADLPDAKSA